MKRFFILFIAIILSAFLLIGCGSNQDAEAIAELQTAADDLQNQVEEYSALKTELDSANDMIAELQSQMDALTAEKDEMSARLEALYKIEPVDETMYTIAEADIYDNLYDGALGNGPAGTIPAEQEIKITGKSAVIDWYEIETDGKKQFISAGLVSETQQLARNGNDGNGSRPSGGNGSSDGGSQPSGGGSQKPEDTTPAQQPSGDDGPPPGVNIGDVVGHDEAGGSDITWGGVIDYSGF